MYPLVITIKTNKIVRILSYRHGTIMVTIMCEFLFLFSFRVCAYTSYCFFILSLVKTSDCIVYISYRNRNRVCGLAFSILHISLI